jgi:hypothetical protein
MTSMPIRRLALKRLVRVDETGGGVERSRVHAPDRPRVSRPDPALLAYLSTRIPGRTSRKRVDVHFGCSEATAKSRTLTGWMVALSVWALVDHGLVDIAVERRGLFRRKRITVTRTCPGTADGVVVSYLTSLPTDDPLAFVDEDTLDRPGPIGDLVRQFRMWREMLNDDPDWTLAKAVFDGAVTAGVCTGSSDDGYTFDCVAVGDLRDPARRLQHSFERAMREQPEVMTLLLRDGQRCIEAMTTPSGRRVSRSRVTTHSTGIRVALEDFSEFRSPPCRVRRQPRIPPRRGARLSAVRGDPRLCRPVSCVGPNRLSFVPAY